MGSSPALGLLLDHYRDYLTQLAQAELDSRLVPKVAHSDMVQETYLQAAHDFGQFAGTSEGELKAWLERILLNNLRDSFRHYQAAQKRSIDCEVAIAGNDSRVGGEELADDESTASQHLMRAEERARLLSAVERLPEDYRRAVRLRSLDGLSFDEVAVAMDRSREAVRKLWSRGIEWLTEDLRRNGCG